MLRKGAIGERLTRFDELLTDLCQQDAEQTAQQRAAWQAQTREEVLESWFGASGEQWSWDLVLSLSPWWLSGLDPETSVQAAVDELLSDHQYADSVPA